MTTEAMIKPANIEEQVLAKIGEMHQKNLTDKQKDKIVRLNRDLVRSFASLTWIYFGVGKSQTLELTDPELNALFNLVYNRAKKTSVYAKIFGWGIPLIGWVAILPESKTIQLADSTRKLKKISGSNFNPAKVIRENINA